MHTHASVTTWGRSFKLYQLQALEIWDLGRISPFYSKSTANSPFHLLVSFLITHNNK